MDRHIDDRQGYGCFQRAERQQAQMVPLIRDDRHFVFMVEYKSRWTRYQSYQRRHLYFLTVTGWNHADSQAMDRCHRMGQTRPVAVYRLTYNFLCRY
jgi:hypothetical protein